MTLRVAAVAVLLLSGCASWSLRRPLRFELAAAAPPSPECVHLDNQQVGWKVAAIVVGSLSGGSGGITAVIPDDTPRYVTGATSVVLAVGSAVSTYLSQVYTGRYVATCQK